MKLSGEQYNEMVKKASPNTNSFFTVPMAFLIGGLICTVGQGLLLLYEHWGMSGETASTLTSMTLVCGSAFTTGLGLYDRLAKHAGAGTLVPITGFANAIASPAVEFKSEGWILGLGANMFKIAGPVIVYGLTASVGYGVIYWASQNV